MLHSQQSGLEDTRGGPRHAGAAARRPGRARQRRRHAAAARLHFDSAGRRDCDTPQHGRQIRLRSETRRALLCLGLFGNIILNHKYDMKKYLYYVFIVKDF